MCSSISCVVSSHLCKGDIPALPVEGIPPQARESSVTAVVCPYSIGTQALSTVTQSTTLHIVCHLTSECRICANFTTFACPTPLLLTLAVVTRGAASIVPLRIPALSAVGPLIGTHTTSATALLQCSHRQGTVSRRSD